MDTKRNDLPNLLRNTKPKVLLIGGNKNQITMLHKISEHLQPCDCFFSPYFYSDTIISVFRKWGLTQSSTLGSRMQKITIDYLTNNDLQMDIGGRTHKYDLAIILTDIMDSSNLKNVKKVLVQEGLIIPEGLKYFFVKTLPIPLWLLNANAAGLSNDYDYFCVASKGYYDEFVKQGIDRNKLVVTGIPNFDNIVNEHSNKKFEIHDFILLATHCHREDFEFENRKKLLHKTRELANGRQIVVKLHPRENFNRAIKEIHRYLPNARVFTDGDTEAMIANCEIFITSFSSTIFTALLLGKEVHCNISLDRVKKLAPLQNGQAARNIANICIGAIM